MFCGIDHKIQRLYIHWDITSKCNYNCKYCYAKKDYKDNWQKTDLWNNQRLVISAIKAARLPVFVGLLGGEPTLHPRFFEIVDNVLLCCSHQDSRLYITSNGSTNVFQNIQYHPKIRFLLSLHPTQESKDPNFSKFFKNLNIIVNKGFKVRVNLMLPTESYLYDKVKTLYKKLSEYHIEIHPHFIYESQCEAGALANYDFSIYKSMINANKEYIYNGIYLNDYEVFSQNLNRFQGWHCWNNNYEITWNGYVQNICLKQQINLKDDPLFFYNIKKIKSIVCPYQQCVCDGLLKTLKVKDVSDKRNIFNV